jgi:putative flippase GtrA
MNRKRVARYLLVGGWNTLFGYGVTVFLYQKLHLVLSILLIATISNGIAISMSFLTHRYWVFKSKGHFLREYLKSFVVYGASGVVSIASLWVMVDHVGLSIWTAQALAMILTVIASYFGHSRFTFREKRRE